MSESIYVLSWVLPIVLVSLGVGVYLGYGLALRRKGDEIQAERSKTLKALHSVVRSTEELSSDVDAHNRDLETVGRTVKDLPTGDYLEEVQRFLVEQISDVVQANQRLENDLVCTRYELQEQAHELDRTRVEARTDNLSGVGNRKAFEESLSFMLAKYQRKGDAFALVLLDVDHFKWVNDTHGHQSGDQVIVILGNTLKQLIRPRDVVARFGGDEFAILLADVDFDKAVQAAQRIWQEIDQTNFDVGVNGACIAVTFSMGMAYVDKYDTSDTLLKKADKALYESKRRGRNQLNWYKDESPAEAAPRHSEAAAATS